jgi:peptide-methionine (S)-S-oxide reductase
MSAIYKPDASTFALLLFGLLVLTCSMLPRDANGQVPESSITAPVQPKTTGSIAVLAGGCFWGRDGVFKHVTGVTGVTSGYSVGTADTAHYETVSTGTTGHAESVEITHDPSRISYSQLLKIFFFVAHNPTELNRQGPDQGSQYRSVIFYANDEQKRIAENYIKQLDQDKAFSDPIVTRIVPLKFFYPAEMYHQNFLERYPDNPYIVFNDMPKLGQLHKQFPALYTPTALGK